MGPETSLTKRIKRHVVGRVRTFFAATAPGFETLCLKELKALGLPLLNASQVAGGVEFKGRLTDCYQANLRLRTANRILMRIDQFKASGFRQIEKKVAGIPWELYLSPESIPQYNVKTRHCRLYHSDAIGERFQKGILEHQRKMFPDDESDPAIQQTIFIRGVDDRFTVSIDSSGDHLHKRGLKKHPGKAPLRETTAAAALMFAGYDGTTPLLDPMCGTGTFSLEAAMLSAKIPAGWFRSFAFTGWPSFRRAHWEYLKHSIEKTFRHRQKPLIVASDTDLSACRHLKKCLNQHQFSNTVSVIQQDFFAIDPKNLMNQTGLVVINPPYGRRLENRPNSERQFIKIYNHLRREYKGWKLVLIAPNQKLSKKVPFNLSKHPISHGGLKPVMMVGEIK